VPAGEADGVERGGDLGDLRLVLRPGAEVGPQGLGDGLAVVDQEVVQCGQVGPALLGARRPLGEERLALYGEERRQSTVERCRRGHHASASAEAFVSVLVPLLCAACEVSLTSTTVPGL
jgi:hypothetical protein